MSSGIELSTEQHFRSIDHKTVRGLLSSAQLRIGVRVCHVTGQSRESFVGRRARSPGVFVTFCLFFLRHVRIIVRSKVHLKATIRLALVAMAALLAAY